MRTSWFGVVVASSLLGVFLHKSTGLSQEITFRQNVRLVEVCATVFDQRGVPVAGLAKDQFRILDDGQPQTDTGIRADFQRTLVCIYCSTPRRA